MPYRRIPNTTPAVLRTLTLARNLYANTPAPAERAISAETYARLDAAVATSLLNRFLKETSEVDQALAAQGPLTGALAQKGAQLTLYVSHFHQVLDLGIARSTFAPGTRGYYGRDIHATSIPDLGSYAALVEAAERVVSGEAARAAAEEPVTFDSGATFDSGLHWDGTHVAMRLPSAAEVGAKLGEFNALRAQSQAALARTDREREEAQALYPEAQALAADICDQVEFFFRKDPEPSSRRVKCARWGVIYIYEDGTEEPPPPPAPPAPAPTP